MVIVDTTNEFLPPGLDWRLIFDFDGTADVELATLEWVNWFNKTRLHSTTGYVSPFEFEKRYYDNLVLSGMAA